MDRLLFQTNIDALQSTKLLEYTSLCRPLLGYADTLQDPANTDSTQETEVVQNKAILEEDIASLRADNTQTEKTKGQKKVAQISDADEDTLREVGAARSTLLSL